MASNPAQKPQNAGRSGRGGHSADEGSHGGGRGNHEGGRTAGRGHLPPQRDQAEHRYSSGGGARNAVGRREMPKMLKPPVVDLGGEGAGLAANECVVCCREISIYAVGPCNHTVCFVCSTRLRVLCKTKECPVCRATVDDVFFIKENKPYAELKQEEFNLKVRRFDNVHFGSICLL